MSTDPARMKIDSHVTDRGGVVIFNGPFPMAQAQLAKRLCDAAPLMFAVIKGLARQLPELNDPDAPLAGSEAVEALCAVWPRLVEAIELVEQPSVITEAA